MKIDYDKKLHFIAGAASAVAAGIACAFIYSPATWLAAAVAPIVAGIGKEFYDARTPAKHTVDANDALATMAGGLVGLIALALVAHLAGYLL